MVCDYKPLKEEKYRARLTIGGEKFIDNDETVSPAASLLKMKIIVNSTISDVHKGAHFMDWNKKNYCGVTFKWHYAAGYVDVSMPGYVSKALDKYQHPHLEYPNIPCTAGINPLTVKRLNMH
eukprot:14685035-Ditylum_brightwellii.AAC.1